MTDDTTKADVRVRKGSWYRWRHDGEDVDQYGELKYRGTGMLVQVVNVSGGPSKGAYRTIRDRDGNIYSTNIRKLTPSRNPYKFLW
jgi:hypothetical protein